MGSKHKKNKAKKTQSKQTASSEAQVYTNQRVRAPCAGLSTQTSSAFTVHRFACSDRQQVQQVAGS